MAEIAEPLLRVQVLSDLHTELGAHAVPEPQKLATQADIVILAGDTGYVPSAVVLAASLFPDAPALFLVGGNHEHYGTDLAIDEGLDAIAAPPGRSRQPKGTPLPCSRTKLGW